MADDDSLTQDYDAHVLFTFSQIPDAPKIENLKARFARWLTISFAESWLAIWLYRAKIRLRRRHTPLVPGLLDVISRVLFRVQIGNEVRIGPGLMITHGQVVIDGRTTIGERCQINPWVTIGLSNSRKLGFSVQGPTIGNNVHIGTGAKVFGPVHVGDGVRIGANAVVVHDVPAGATVVGIPARALEPALDPAELHAVAEMREAITRYRTKEIQLRSLVDVLVRWSDRHPAALDGMHDQAREELAFLDAVAATGGDESRQVETAIATIEGALRSP